MKKAVWIALSLGCVLVNGVGFGVQHADPIEENKDSCKKRKVENATISQGESNEGVTPLSIFFDNEGKNIFLTHIGPNLSISDWRNLKATSKTFKALYDNYFSNDLQGLGTSILQTEFLPHLSLKDIINLRQICRGIRKQLPMQKMTFDLSAPGSKINFEAFNSDALKMIRVTDFSTLSFSDLRQCLGLNGLLSFQWGNLGQVTDVPEGQIAFQPNGLKQVNFGSVPLNASLSKAVLQANTGLEKVILQRMSLTMETVQALAHLPKLRHLNINFARLDVENQDQILASFVAFLRQAPQPIQLKLSRTLKGALLPNPDFQNLVLESAANSKVLTLVPAGQRH